MSAYAVTVLVVYNFTRNTEDPDRLCGLVVRVLGYRSGGPGSIPGIKKKLNSMV
jgi:hypothetical protein